MRTRYAVLLLVVSAAASVATAPPDWPMWGGTPQRNMTSAIKDLPGSWDAKNGTNIKWKVPLASASNGNPVVADGKVYIGDQDGDVAVLQAGPEFKKIAEIDMGNSVYSTPVPASGVLYVMTRSELYAIAAPASPRR
jgi:outer membrane protein assembly factor BamB